MRPEARRGFTLVELLLTVGLLLLLAGAVIFSFSSLQRGAGLEEGATRLEALLRFARAHAAGTGRQVQIRFEEDVGEGLLVPLGRLRVVWEPDPLLQPGFFEELPEANVYVKGITELVSIEEVRPWPRDESPASSSALAPARGQDEGVEAPGEFAPMLFYPDGSADSTEIVLAALDGEDPRRLAVRFMGMTGTIHRRLVPMDNNGSTSGGDEPSPGVKPPPGSAAPTEAGGVGTK